MTRNIPKLIQTKFFLTIIALIIICPSQGLVTAETDNNDLATLIHQFKTGDSRARRDAAHKIGAMGPAAKEAVPVLAEALEGRTKRILAFKTLSSIGPAAKAAIPALATAMESYNHNISSRSALTLQRIGVAATPTLARALWHVRGDVRGNARNSLRMMNPFSVFLGIFFYLTFHITSFVFLKVLIILTAFIVILFCMNEFRRRAGKRSVLFPSCKELYVRNKFFRICLLVCSPSTLS